MNHTRPSLFGRILFITFTSFVGTEFLTGSLPVALLPQTLRSPTLPILLCLYGSGALLVREAAVIWKKGWLSILAFGAAYAIIEEGIFAKTWFATVSITYGKWLGVNWAFGFAETIVESLFFIAIPIALSRVAFPGSESERWFSNKALAFVGLLYLIVVALGFRVSFQEYTQPQTQIPLALVMTAALMCIGCIIGSPTEQLPPQGRLASPKAIALLYFGATLAVFLIAPVWMMPGPPHSLPPLLADSLAASLVILIFRFLHRTALSSRQLFAAMLGIASVMMLAAIVGPQHPRGTALAVPVYLGLLLFAWRRMKEASVQ